jgi:hypothetical protein
MAKMATGSKLHSLFIVLAVMVLLGCSQTKNFDYGVKQINLINSRYKTTMHTYPADLNAIDQMINEYKELKKIELERDNEQFNYVVDYRILNLEAERFHILGNKYGSSGSTKDGFGCKQRPIVTESVYLRNQSAFKGFEAVGLLNNFVSKHKEYADRVNLSAKQALFLNATFFEVHREARRDSGIINNFCSWNVTLEIYAREFRKKTNFSEDFIRNLTYEKAVSIWKELNGIS